MNARSDSREHAAQLSLFGAPAPAGEAHPAGGSGSHSESHFESHSALAGRGLSARAAVPAVSPYLLAARRLSRQIRRLPEHSARQTETGLAICRALKAYLEDHADRTH